MAIATTTDANGRLATASDGGGGASIPLDLSSVTGGTGYIELAEQSPEPGAPAVNKMRVYAKDDGTGVTELAIEDSAGAKAQLAMDGIRFNRNGNVDFVNEIAGGMMVRLPNTGIVTIRGGNAGGVSLGATNLASAAALQTSVDTVSPIAQSGTAGYTAMRVTAAEASLGSGTKRLLEAMAGAAGATLKWAVDNNGLLEWIAGNQQATVGAAGAAAALPITPETYLKVKDSAGNTRIVPAYLP